MKTEGHRLDEAVLQAATLEGDEREAYLDEIAAADPALVSLVRHRLAAAEGISTFLERPAAERLGDVGEDQAPAAEAPPSTALPPEERYELGEHLGRGGMGRVVEAYDHQLGRRVALKFLTSERPAIRDLFLREGRAQARVRHPHVLDVYDSGVLAGQPFLSMRPVDGGTLAEVAPKLSLEHQIRLLIQVAEGLHAAHHRGLLHRDVKPANVLVEETPDGDLTAYVSDFGIAADLADEDGLAGDRVLGSPQYIAPERLGGSGVVDRRSDVYSLGVAMYRILTGSLPFEGSLTVDVLRETLRSEPPPPREKDPHLPAEVEAIILRCLARDPDDRYASARAVANELRRFLDGEVVEAYAAGLAYRTTRFVLRHRLLVGMAALAVAALFVASIAVAVFAFRADAARERAERRQGQAEELIRFMVVDLQDKLEPVSRLEVLDDVGRAATEYFAAVPEEDLSEEELLRRSRMLYQLGSLRVRQGDLAGAAAPMAESLELTRRLHELVPEDPERLFELGQSWFWVGYVAWERRDAAAAQEAFEQYLQISRRLVRLDPDDSAYRIELSYALSNLGTVLQAQWRLEEALALFERSLGIKQRVTAAVPESAQHRLDLADSHNTVGVVLLLLGRPQAALRHLERELALREALVDEAPGNRVFRSTLATTHSYLGKALSAAGKPERARAEATVGRDLLEKLVAHDPDDKAMWNKLVWSHIDLGLFAYKAGEIEPAEDEWRSARSLLDRLLAGADDPVPGLWRQAQGAIAYCFALAYTGRDDSRARAEVLVAIEILERLAAERPTDFQVARWWAWSQQLLACLETSPAAAEAALGRATEILEPFALPAASESPTHQACLEGAPV